MKIFAYILSIFILVLTAIPCADKPQDNTLQKVELSNTTSNHPSDFDHCTPFCTCQCCQTNIYFPSISAPFTAVGLEISYNEYSPTFQSIELFDFLIPPKS